MWMSVLSLECFHESLVSKTFHRQPAQQVLHLHKACLVVRAVILVMRLLIFIEQKSKHESTGKPHLTVQHEMCMSNSIKCFSSKSD